jgi:transcriptional regulator with XRE-family HTH domain
MKNYTMQELADLTGLTHGYVRDLECLSIDKTPLLETIGKFADALEIDIRQLFDNVDLDNKK